MEALQLNQYIKLNIDLDQYRNEIIDEIIFGKKLKFNYINLDKYNELNKKLYLTNNFNSLELLKFNIIGMINQLINFFPDIKFSIYFDSQCATECNLKESQYSYKFGLYLIINKDNKYYEYGFDFITDLIEISDRKYNDSKILLDNYEYFLEEDIINNNDNEKYIINSIFKLLITICTLKDDEYQLAEIMFIKSNQDAKIDLKQLLKEIGYFTRIITWKKDNNINLEDLYDELQLVDEKTEETIDYNQFTKIINKICKKQVINFNITEKTINFEIFEALLLNISTDIYSIGLNQYKRIYQKAINTLMYSLKIIIETIKEINSKKKFISEYINNFISFHLNEYKNKKVLNQIFNERINEYKESFDNIINDIETYNNNNEYKLEKIQDNIESIYETIFSAK
jgi:hypothetical protein